MSASNEKIKILFQWCINQTKLNEFVDIKNFTTSWRNGLGFLAILANYLPKDKICFNDLKQENIYDNNNLAFQLAEQEFGIPSLLDPNDMVIMKVPDRLSMITYLFQYYSALNHLKCDIKSIDEDQRPPLTALENLSIDDKKSIQLNDEDSENKSPLCPICEKAVFMLEKMSLNNKIYHRSCYRSNQLVNLAERNRTLERNAIPLQSNNSELDKGSLNYSNVEHLSINASSLESLTSTSSINNISHKRPAPLAPNTNSKPKINILPADNPSSNFLTIKPRTKFNTRSSPDRSSTDRNRSRVNDDVDIYYPDNLNPFGDETTTVSNNPFSRSRSKSPLSDNGLRSSSLSQDKNLQVRVKRKAPPTPKQIQTEENSEPVEAVEVVEQVVESNSPSKTTNDTSYTSNTQSTNDNDTESIVIRAIDHLENSEHKSDRQRSLNKPPAPPRPAPPKRQIRGAIEEFIPYETIYEQLELVNTKQSEVEMRGRTLQNALWETKEEDDTFEEMLQDWLELVKEKNDLFLQEKRLHEVLKRQELEERQADLEHEMHILMSKQESQKTALEKAREEELLHQILDTVNKRSEMLECDSDTEMPVFESVAKPRKSRSTLKNWFSIRRGSSIDKGTLTKRLSKSMTKSKGKNKSSKTKITQDIHKK